MAAQDAARVYLLWGEDTLSRDDLVRSFRARMLARPGGALNLSEFHAPDLQVQDLITTCDTVPFLDERRLVIVHQLFGWRPRTSARRRGETSQDGRGEGGGQLKSEREAFLAYLPHLAPQTTLILVEPALPPAQRAELVAQVPMERADLRFFEAPRGAQLDRWLARRAQHYGGELGPAVADLVRQHGPTSLEALDQEIAKLVTYAGEDQVSSDDVRELLSGAELVIFDLLDAVAEGRSGDALRTLRRLIQQGQRPEELTPQVISLYRRLLVCRLAMQERADAADIARAQGVKLYDKLRSQARGLLTEDLQRGLELLLAYDRKLKRSEVDPEAGLELLIVDLAGLVRRETAANLRSS